MLTICFTYKRAFQTFHLIMNVLTQLSAGSIFDIGRTNFGQAHQTSRKWPWPSIIQLGSSHIHVHIRGFLNITLFSLLCGLSKTHGLIWQKQSIIILKIDCLDRFEEATKMSLATVKTYSKLMSRYSLTCSKMSFFCSVHGYKSILILKLGDVSLKRSFALWSLPNVWNYYLIMMVVYAMGSHQINMKTTQNVNGLVWWYILPLVYLFSYS